MAKRNLFISIGSTSANALIALIERLQDLGIYKPLDPNFKDMFVAFDTDQGPLMKIKTYNKGDRDHAFGFHFSRSGADDVPSHEFLRHSYRPEWIGDTLKILEAHQGVGGKRYKSFATVEWIDSLNRMIDEFYQGIGGADTLNDCQIILVASAWGGTASGMFQNVADFIARKVYEKCGANKLTPFYTVLALPNLNEANSARNEKSYQGIENFAYFMRSVQQAGWRGTLSKIIDSEQHTLNFIFPELCDFTGDATANKIPVYAGSARFCGTESPLPQRAIITIPTQSAGTTSVTVAEQLLLLAYLDVLKQPLNSEGSITADGKFIDVRARWAESSTVDCPALIGINMVECQYPRGAAIKKAVEQNLISRWKKFYSELTSIDPHVPLFISDYIQRSVKIPSDSTDMLNYLNQKLNTDWLASNERIVDLKKSIETFINDSKNIQYVFPAFDNAKELLAGMVTYSEKLNEDDPQKSAFDNSITLQDIRIKYNEQLNNWYVLAEADEKQKLGKIMKMIDYTIAEHNRLSKGKGFNNFIVKYCNGNIQVVKNFLNIAREEISAALTELQHLMLTKAIVRRWQLEQKNSVENDPNWIQVDQLIHNVETRLLASENEGERNRFIKSVKNEELEETLKNLVAVQTDDLVRLLKESDQVADLQSAYDTIRNDIHDKIDVKLKDYKDGGNYKMITLSGSNLTGCCPCYYPTKLTGSMFHFYAKSAGAGDITWEDVDKFGFKTFAANCMNGQVCGTRSNVESHAILKGGSMGTWVENNVTYDGQTVCGMWFGSVDIGLTFREVLDKVYANGQSNSVSTLTMIQDAAFQLEHGTIHASKQSISQCSQSLFEKVVMGAVFGLINEKAMQISLKMGQSLTVSVKTPTGNIIWEKSSKNVADMGLISSGSGNCMKSVSADFIRVLMDWMQENNIGSSKFADAFDCKELFNSLLNQDRYVLSSMRLAPTDEQVNMILALYKKLSDCIELTVS